MHDATSTKLFLALSPITLKSLSAGTLFYQDLYHLSEIACAVLLKLLIYIIWIDLNLLVNCVELS